MSSHQDEGTAAWHRDLQHTPHDQLSEETTQTPGMRRYEAISGKRNGSRKIWMGKSHVAPGMLSGDHHHGEAETGIYIVSGHPVFVFLENGAERRIETGDIFAPVLGGLKMANGENPKGLCIAGGTRGRQIRRRRSANRWDRSGSTSRRTPQTTGFPCESRLGPDLRLRPPRPTGAG